MSLKAKLVSTISAFCLVLALMVVGVLAATTATVSLGGSLSFTAKDVYAKVTVTSEGATTNLTGGDGQNKTFDSTTAEDGTANAWKVKNLDLEFASKTGEIVIAIKIDNLSTERAIDVDLTALPSVATGNNVEVDSIKYTNDSATTADPATTLTTDGFQIAAGDTAIIEMTISITNPNGSVNEATATWSADFTLNNVAAAA